MTRIFLVRHGQTLWNHNSRYQGQTDIELSEEGCHQSKLLAKKLASVQIDAVYASDLKRALKTASILAEPHQLEVQGVTALREVHFGAWEGLTYREIVKKYPEVAEQWVAAPANVRIPEGETFNEVKERSYQAIRGLVKKHDSGKVIVVAHGGTIRTIICALLDLDLNHAFQLGQDNTALNILDFYDSTGILTLLNDTDHLNIFSSGKY